MAKSRQAIAAKLRSLAEVLSELEQGLQVTARYLSSREEAVIVETLMKTFWYAHVENLYAAEKELLDGQ